MPIYIYHTLQKIIFFILLIFIATPLFWGIYKQYDHMKHIDSFQNRLNDIPLHLSFKNITFYTLDQNKNPVLIKAPQAIAKGQKADEITLIDAEMNITTKNNDHLTLKAHKAFINQEDKKIRLQKDIVIYDHEKKNIVRTQKVFYDLKKGILNLPQKVSFSGEKASIQANKAVASKDKEKISFKGGVHLSIDPNK